MGKNYIETKQELGQARAKLAEMGPASERPVAFKQIKGTLPPTPIEELETKVADLEIVLAEQYAKGPITEDPNIDSKVMKLWGYLNNKDLKAKALLNEVAGNNKLREQLIQFIPEFNGNSIFHDLEFPYLDTPFFYEGMLFNHFAVDDPKTRKNDLNLGDNLTVKHVTRFDDEKGHFVDWLEDQDGKPIVDPKFYKNLTADQVLQLAKVVNNPCIIRALQNNTRILSLAQPTYAVKEDDYLQALSAKELLENKLRVDQTYPDKLTTDQFRKYALDALENFKDNPVFVAQLKHKIKARIMENPNEWLNLDSSLRGLFSGRILQIISIDQLNDKKDLTASFIRAIPNLSLDQRLNLLKNQEKTPEIIQYAAELQLQRLKPSPTAPLNQEVLQSLHLWEVLAVYKECLNSGRIPKEGQAGLFKSRDPEGLLDALKLRMLELAKASDDPVDFFKKNCSKNSEGAKLLSHHRDAFTLRSTSSASRVGTTLANVQEKNSAEAKTALQELDNLIQSKRPPRP